MLQTDDVGRFFAIMQSNYGARWPHRADAIPVWQHKLRSWTASDLMEAADEAIDAYPDWPPTIAQVAALRREQRKTNYLPPPQAAPSAAVANRMLLQIIRNNFGVDSNTMRCLVDMKNEMVAEHNSEPTEEFLAELEAALSEVAKNHNQKTKAAERDAWRPR